MKQFLPIFGVLCILSSGVSAQYTTSTSTRLYPSRYASGSSYWSYVNDYYKNKYNLNTTTTQSTTAVSRNAASWNGTPSYRTTSTNTNSSSTYVRQLPVNYASGYTPATTTTSRSTWNPSGYSTQSTTNSYVSGATVTSGTRVSFTPIPQREALQSIDSAPIDLFEVGIHNARGSSSVFQEAIELDSVTFQMYATAGVASDPTDFEIVVGDESARFNTNGEVTIQFDQSVRVASGQSQSFTAQVRLRDPLNVSYSSGNFRVRVLGANIREELSGTLFKAQLSGTTSSNVIAFDPVGGPLVSGQNAVFTTIPSNSTQDDNLVAGQSANVLALGFNAYFDNLYVRELVIQEKSGNNNVDVLIESIKAVDANTGEVFDTAKFVNGKAQFDFNSGIYLPRREERDIVFIAEIEQDLPRNVDPSFTLTLPISGLDVISYSNGNSVNLSSNNIALQENEFTVVNSQVDVTYNNQLSYINVTNSPEPILRFQINNPGSDSISVSRLSFEIFPSGMAFEGGISADDFELVALKSNGSESNSPQFNVVSASGNTVVFDAINSEYNISAGVSKGFFLKANLVNTGASSDGDSVATRIVRDSSSQKGTLSSLKASGASFIWSDQSGRPHTFNSSDYLNGNSIDGIGQAEGVRR